MDESHFTLAQATKLLPSLTPLLAEIQRLHRRMETAAPVVSDLQERAYTNGHVAHTDRLMSALDRQMETLQSLIARINDLGVLIKDLDIGLIDFPAWRDGREIYLCWRLGEPSIAYWHETTSGFADRQPITWE